MLVTWTVKQQCQWMPVVNRLLASKVESVSHMDSATAGSMNASS